MGYEGQIILNYKLTAKLGEGGFGAVYLAEQVDLGRRAACKILHPMFARNPEIVERFFREARAVCAIGHRAIVAIENFGMLPGGEPFYLMEYFAGSALSELSEERALTSAQLVAIFDPIADALTAAHAKQIIHRDLKPDNIMVRLERDQVVDVRLLDFGIAKLLEADSASLTGGAMGTPSYMAPEQALDAKSVDVRADVYAFGATVYAAIAGIPPFDGSTTAAILIKVQTEPAIALLEQRGDVNESLSAATMRCLAKAPDERPPTIAAAWATIRTALLSAGLSANPRPRTHLPPTIHAPATSDPVTRDGRAASPSRAQTLIAPDPVAAPAPRGKIIALVAAGVLASVITVIAIAATRGHGEPAATTAPRVDPAPGSAVASAGAPPDAPLDAPPPELDAPPVAVAPDAAIVADAAVPDAAVARATPVRPPATPKVQPPRTGACTEASFQSILGAASPGDAQVEEAIQRLKGCKAQLDADAYRRIQQALVGKL